MNLFVYVCLYYFQLLATRRKTNQFSVTNQPVAICELRCECELFLSLVFVANK